jgi:hypothetical protein
VNALDYVYLEWNCKPAGFVSYGGVSGGLRAVQAVQGSPGLSCTKLPFPGAPERLGAELPGSAGFGRSIVTMRPPPSKTAERDWTERKIHPEKPSPCLTPVAVLEVSSKKIAIRPFSPIIVPTRVKGGSSNATGLAAAGGGAGAAATAGDRGRRDAENNGRSRVAESFEMGMTHKGFPIVEGWEGGDPASAGASPLPSGLALLVSTALSVSNAATEPWFN